MLEQRVPVDSSTSDVPDITFLGFNQDQTCLAVGTRFGFMIFSTENFALLHNEHCGAVSIVEMLFRTSLLALVGSDSQGSSSSSNRQLTMWNTKERCDICRLSFNAKIHGVKMNHRRVVALLEQKIHIFDLKTLKSLHVIDRTLPPTADPALSWLCAASGRGYLATPHALTGGAPGPLCGGQGHAWASVHSVSRQRAGQSPCNYGRLSNASSGALLAQGGEGLEAKVGLVTLIDVYTLKPVGTVLAHQTSVQALCLNPTGQLLATASEKGTVIRLFSVPGLEMLCAYRRGSSVCRIFGLLFSRDSAHICASAASGTVHLFRNSERVLGSLPLQSEEATVGAAQREMISRAVPTPAPDTEMSPERTSPKAELVDPIADRKKEDEPEDVDDFSEWQVVAERPERLLELSLNSPSQRGGGSICMKQNALQTLSAASEYAVGHSTKYAKSLLQLLPQPCLELVDAARATAWVHLREEEEELRGQRRDIPIIDALRYAGLTSLPERFAHGGYVACMNLKPRDGRCEVLVATERGCAHIYEFSPVLEGEGRLRTEHSFMGQLLQSSRADSMDVSSPSPPPPVVVKEPGACDDLCRNSLT